MIVLVERSRLPLAPDRIWRFFAEEVEERYPEWHREHLCWRWLCGQPLEKGAIWFADEWVGAMRVSTRFIVEESRPARFFSYRLAFPSSLVRAGGSFRMEPAEAGGSELIQEIRMGFTTPLIGRMVDLVITAAVPIGELRRHIREEQANLVRLLSAADDEDE